MKCLEESLNQVLIDYFERENVESIDIPQIVVIDKNLSDYITNSNNLKPEQKTVLICTDDNCRLTERLEIVLISKSALGGLSHILRSLSESHHEINKVSYKADLVFQSDSPNDLSDKEIKILRCISNGLTNDQTAKEVGLKPNTIKGYLQFIFTKLNAKDRAHAVSIGIRSGLI